jgi:hypothetical protein
VKGVQLGGDKDKESYEIECDTVVITGKFRPDSSLIDFTPIEMDSATSGPLIDSNFMTSVPNIFAAGNVLRGADMHDLCALEGKRAAQSILNTFERTANEEDEGIFLTSEAPIRYVVPQKIMPGQIKSVFMQKLLPGCSIQLEHSFERPVLEAWSADKLIWSRPYRRLIANHRIPIPVWKFDLSRVDENSPIRLRLRKKTA